MNKLKEIRVKHYLSQEQLAKISGITEQTIVSIEKGRRKPQFVTIHKLANALNVKPDEFNFD